MAGPIVSTPFQRGRPVGWAELEALRNEIARLKPNSGVGYRLNQSPSGWSLSIPSPTTGSGGATAVCPFQVTTANEGDDWKFTIAWGMVGVPPVLPIGMLPNNDPPLKMDWNDGWVYMRVEFVENDTAVKEVQFKNETEIPAADTTYAYYPIAYIDTDSTNSENPTQRIQNLCSAPIPSVCDLALPTSP
jgi:hypothetical protein